MGKWFCTDSDCDRIRRQIDDFTWSYIGPRELDNGHWVVSYATIDIRDYSLDELWAFCAPDYNSFEEIVELHGFRDALCVMSECVFEQLGFDDMEFNSEQQNLRSAIEFIKEWTDSH